jgi:hypothetical protein
MKQFATWFTHGVPGGAKLRASIYHARTGYDVLGEVERFFATLAGADAESTEISDGTEMFPDAALACD